VAIGDALEPEFDALHEKVQTEILALSRLEKRSNLLLSTLANPACLTYGSLTI
jgi:hypothetical protein